MTYIVRHAHTTYQYIDSHANALDMTHGESYDDTTQRLRGVIVPLIHASLNAL